MVTAKRRLENQGWLSFSGTIIFPQGYPHIHIYFPPGAGIAHVPNLAAAYRALSGAHLTFRVPRWRGGYNTPHIRMFTIAAGVLINHMITPAHIQNIMNHLMGIGNIRRVRAALEALEELLLHVGLPQAADVTARIAALAPPPLPVAPVAAVAPAAIVPPAALPVAVAPLPGAPPG